MKGKQNEYVLMQFEMGTPKKLPPIAGVASYMFASSTQKKNVCIKSSIILQ